MYSDIFRKLPKNIWKSKECKVTETTSEKERFPNYVAAVLLNGVGSNHFAAFY